MHNRHVSFSLSVIFAIISGLQSMSVLAEQHSVADIVERVAPSVVYIEGETGAGSGFVVSTNPWIDILTNHHVMDGGRSFSISFFLPTGEADETRKVRVENARPFFAFPRLDFGFIRLDNSDPKVAELKAVLKPIPVGNSKATRVGERVVITGSPGAGMTVLGNSVSDGIISGKNRHIRGLPYFQTTAPVNPGNSGGPLLNSRGEVIGIVTSKSLFAENIAFALPMHMTDQKNYDFYMPEGVVREAAEPLKRAQQHLDGGRFAQARAEFRKASKASPGRAKPIIREGDAAVRDGKPADAARLYEEALEVADIRYDDMMFCILDLGRIYGRKGEHEKAIEIFERGLARDPTHSDLNRNIGVAYASTGKHQRALAHWMMSLWVEPDQPTLEKNIEGLLKMLRR